MISLSLKKQMAPELFEFWSIIAPNFFIPISECLIFSIKNENIGQKNLIAVNNRKKILAFNASSKAAATPNPHFALK